jgi:hypothetical protein
MDRMAPPPSTSWPAQRNERAERKRIVLQTRGAERTAAADNRLTMLTKIEQRSRQMLSPCRTVGAFILEAIIDPRDTCPPLREFANMAASQRTSGQSMFAMRP